MQKLVPLVLSMVFALAPQARADDGVARQQKQIAAFVGSWVGKGTIESEGKVHPVTMTWDCVAAAAATGVACKATIVGLPGFTYTFNDLWGVSPADGLVHWYTVTNAGEVHDHRGHLGPDGGMLQVELPTEGKVFSEVIHFKAVQKGCVMSWTTSLGGEMRERGEITLTRK